MENENPLLGEIQTYWSRRADSYSAEVQYELTHKNEAVWMDVQALEFSDGCFDAVVTRNLTWNLEHPDQAYREWYRVLREGGILLNFDAYSESAKMEEISRQLILSHCKRPETDIEMLHAAGFEEVSVDMRIGDRVWDETEKVNYGSRPMFLLFARK